MLTKSRVALSYIRKIIRREREFRAAKLKQALIEITFKCNLRCQMCGVWSDKDPRWQNELSEDEWIDVIDNLADYGCERVYLSGGEPTILPGFGRIIKRAKEHGMDVSFNTNGTCLSQWIPDICSSVDTVYVSVDAPDERHDKIRGIDGTFEKTIDSIRQLIDYKQKNGFSKPLVHMATVLSSSNADCICSMVKLADDLGIDIISLRYLSATPLKAIQGSVLDGKRVTTDRYAAVDGEKLYVDDEGLKLIRKGFNNIPETKKTWVLADPTKSLPDESFTTGIFPIKRCVNVSNVLMVMPDGETTVCPHIAGYTMGNVRNKSIREIWESDERKRLKNHLNEQLFPICLNCSYFSNTLTIDQFFRIALHRCLTMSPKRVSGFDHKRREQSVKV